MTAQNDLSILDPAEIVNRLGFGTARLGAFWQKRSPQEGLKALNLALDLGVGLVDTADVYARGISERIVGRAVRHRGGVTVMSKVGLVKTPVGIQRARRAGCHVGAQGLAREGSASTCFAPGYLEMSAMACIRRQRRDDLDVLLLHEPNEQDLARGEVADAMESMRSRGVIRAWGASVRTREAALAALDLPGLTYLQAPVNLSDTAIADAIQQHPARRGVTVIGLAVLGDGDLLERTTRAGIPRDRAVAGLVTGAASLSEVDKVLLGMSRPEHVLANIRALERGVSPSEVERIEHALESGTS